MMCVTLLWGTFFLEVGVLVALGLLMAVVLTYLSLAKGQKLDTIGILLLLNIGFWLATGLAVGSISLTSFASPRFYNGEGRILISVLPLLALCVVPFSTWELERIRKHVTYLTVVSVTIYLIWLVTGTRALSGEGHADEFHAFFTSHTGAGTFFGCLAVFAILWSAESRRVRHLFVALLLLGPVFSSGSREALLGVLVALGWYYGVKRKNPKMLIPVALVILAMIPAIEMMSSKTYNRTVGMVSGDTISGIVDQTKAGIKSDWAVGDWNPTDGNSNLESGDVTTLVRIMLWVYASKCFVDSPWVGIGWGRFNDRTLVLTDTPMFNMALDGRQVFNTASAHNSYFHILAESGLFGMALYLTIWVALYFRCRKAETLFKPIQNLRAYYVASQGLVVYILTCALTGHALAAPSVMIPVLTLLGAGAAYYREAVKIGKPNLTSSTPP